MIRPAKFVDVPRIVELLIEMQQGGKYAGIDEVDEKAAHLMVAHGVQRNGGTNYGATLLLVSEKDGEVEGFFYGALDRVYHVGKRLMANDVFLYLTEEAEPRDLMRLLSAYIDWAEQNPKVAMIKLSWTDALPDAERIEKVYDRLGFERTGAIWERVEGEIDLGVAA